MSIPELLSPLEIKKKSSQLENWSVLDDQSLVAVFDFEDFGNALEFTVKVGLIAEELQHHPEINLSWGRVALEITTNDQGGLTDLDFLFAEKINGLFTK
ncbi:MAG: 4a-hydroxytetrahydrobiopterin dehydratase [Methanobacteriaceae archaeon]|nr:4a-hydroxytetrahydrobiopterin dehydratase [Methanobacteriaceae archaeon]